MEKEIENITTVWSEYEKGINYNRRKNIYTNTERNYNFFHGKQWENAKLGDMQPIVFNVIKPIVKYKTGVINQNAYSVVLTPMYTNAGIVGEKAEKLCEQLSKHIDKFFENQKITKKLRTIVSDACINSEGILYQYFDENEGIKGDIVAEIIDKNNVYFGDETNPEIEEQPYIIIAFRKPVKFVKEEAANNGLSDEEIALILSDDEIEEQAGIKNDNEEITPMCIELLKLYKKENEKGVKTVYFTKCTKHVEIVKDKNTDLRLYPVAHFVWEEEKGNARGVGEVEFNIPNQIEINKTEMRRAITEKTSAYPKLVYNKSYIKNSSVLKQTGAEIAVEGAGIDDIRKHIGYINGTSMSADSKYLLEELINYTQDLAGAGDNASGNIDITKTSGKAILAVQQAKQQPLNEQLYKYKEFLESVARIYLDMLQNYMINGIIIEDVITQQIQDENGVIKTENIKVGVPVTYEELNEIKANIKVDITPCTAFSKMDMEQSLENLFTANKITFEEWVNALSFDSSYPKKQLDEIIEKRKQDRKDIEAMQIQAQNNMSQIQNMLQQYANEEDIKNIENTGQENINNFLQSLSQNGGGTNAM